MPSLRELVDARLDALGLRRKHLAERLDIDQSRLSKLLLGTAPMPVEDAARWATALELVGGEAEALTDAVHVAGASERVQQLVDRLRTEVADLNARLVRYRSRVGEARLPLDHVEPDVSTYADIARLDAPHRAAEEPEAPKA